MRIAVVFFLLSFAANAQVANDNIVSRSTLYVDSLPIYSSTHQATVEWRCINKKLTEKCLVYHNDQWFTFTPSNPGRLYLNIAEQQCANKYGVQVLVLEGNPCQAASYKLRHCESFTNQSDTHIVLDSLQAGVQYLVNIDGFLGDLCTFSIQLGTKPVGLKSWTRSLDTLQLSLSRASNLVVLSWEAPSFVLDSCASFEIHRQEKNEFKRRVIQHVPIQANALGKPRKEYVAHDTLKHYGQYTYSIVGVFADQRKRVLLDQKKLDFQQPFRPGPRQHTIEVPITAKKKSDFDFLVINEITGEVLFKRQCLACTSQVIELDVSEEVKRGVGIFRVEYLNARTGEQGAIVHSIAQKSGDVKK